jgi:hypothetical protein
MIVCGKFSTAYAVEYGSRKRLGTASQLGQQPVFDGLTIFAPQLNFYNLYLARSGRCWTLGKGDFVVSRVFVTLFEPVLDFDAGEHALSVSEHVRDLQLEVVGGVFSHGFSGKTAFPSLAKCGSKFRCLLNEGSHCRH